MADRSISDSLQQREPFRKFIAFRGHVFVGDMITTSPDAYHHRDLTRIATSTEAIAGWLHGAGPVVAVETFPSWEGDPGVRAAVAEALAPWAREAGVSLSFP